MERNELRTPRLGSIAMERTLQALCPDVETSSLQYARRFEGEAGEYFLETQERFAGALLSRLPRQSLSALDVGGGHAQLLALFLRLGYRVTVHGSDARCRDRIRPFEETHPETVNFVESPLPGVLPFRDGEFEFVSAIRLLAHIDDWRGFVGELCRVSSQAILIDYAPLFGWNALTPIMFHVKKLIEKNTRPYLCQFDTSVRRAFNECGFDVIGLEKQFFFPMGLHRALQNGSLSGRAEELARRCGLTKLFGSPALLLAVRRGRTVR